jgi:hypothetical protein
MIRTSGKSSRVIFIVLRFMRTPIMALVAVYAVSMVGWVMIPGQTPDGQSERLSFFHAFYFLTYTATTTGFGEIPYPFSDAQRMWGILSLYGSVIAWLYSSSKPWPSGASPRAWPGCPSHSLSSAALATPVASWPGA